MLAQMFPGMEWMLAVIGLIVLALIASLIAGVIFLIRGTMAPAIGATWKRRLGHVCLGIALMAPPMFCLLGGRFIFPASNVHLREQITVGMTVTEVKSLLGEPRQRISRKDGSSYWHYPCDWWGFDFFMVSFDSEGRVDSAQLVG